MGNRDYERAFSALANFKKRRGESKLLLALEGVAYLRTCRFEEARRHWAEYCQRADEDADFAAQRSPSSKPFFDPPNQGYFLPLAQVNHSVPAQDNVRICVYTALFGGYDELRALAYKPEGWDFICFTDKPFAATGWDVRLLDPPGGSHAMKNRRLKILPYESLSEYDCSLYLDSNVALLGDPSHLYRRWLREQPFVAWRHPQRGSIFEELEAIIASSRGRPASIIDQYAFFTQQKVPDFVPMIEANFLWGIIETRVSGHSWSNYGRISATSIPGAISPDFPISCGRPEFAPQYCLTTSAPVATTSSFANCPQAECNGSRAIQAKPIRFVGAQDSEAVDLGSPRKVQRSRIDLMRADQLAEIARRYLDGKVEIGNINELGLDEPQDAILVLTKGFLKDASLDELTRLKERGNILCADYVDDPERHELHEAIDVYVAASIRQFIK
jgi:hypothetical protein